MADPLAGLTAGTWGNDGYDGRDCAHNPHVIEQVGPDRIRFLWVQPIHSQLNGLTRESLATILERRDQELIILLDNETRLASDGAPQRMSLALIDEGQGYCMRSTERARGTCWNPSHRCTLAAGS